jgi:putative oxidoreductase
VKTTNVKHLVQARSTAAVNIILLIFQTILAIVKLLVQARSTAAVNIVLWILQALLAVVFALQGFALISSPVAMKPVFDALPFSRRFLILIGVLQILGGIGLIVPYATRILPWLTPLAAVGLGIIMLGAIGTHASRGEFGQLAPIVVILALLAFVTVQRLVKA